MASRSLNKVMIIGNLTRDIELRYTSTGTPIATFGVATNREYVPSNATEAVEETEFHNIVAWSKLAELCDKLLSKGQKVYIEGRLRTRSWEDEQSGKTMYRTEITAEEMIVLSPAKNRPENQENPSVGQEQKPEEQAPTENSDTGSETAGSDGIPF